MLSATSVRITSDGGMPAAGTFARLRISPRSSDSGCDAFSRAILKLTNKKQSLSPRSLLGRATVEPTETTNGQRHAGRFRWMAPSRPTPETDERSNSRASARSESGISGTKLARNLRLPRFSSQS